MRKRTRVGCLTLATLLLISSVNASAIEVSAGTVDEENIVIETAEEEVPEGLTLTASGDGYILEEYEGSATTLDLTAYNITSVAEKAFYGNEYLTEVKLPDSVEVIGEWAFYGCSALSKCELPSNLKSIGTGAFVNTALREVTIPASCVTIGGNTENTGAFCRCENLRTVTFEERTEELSLGDAVFADCTKLQKLQLPEQVYSIPEYLCKGDTALTEVTVPENCTEILNYAFKDCTSLAKVNIPDACTSIGNQAFYKAALTDITIPISCNNIGEKAFYACEKLKSVNFTESEESSASYTIGASAFYGCGAMTSITLPDAMTVINESMFNGCSKLTNVQISADCEVIGEKAFYGCSALKEITIPEKCIMINKNAFTSVSALEKVTFLNFDTGFNTYAFDANSSSKEGIIFVSEPDGAVEEYAREKNYRYQRPTEALAITNNPDKKIYYYGENLLLDGITISADFVSETEPTTAVVDAADCEILGFNSSKVGAQEITVAYGGAETTFEVTVAYDLSMASASANDLEYTGEALTNTFEVKGSETGVALVEGKDYYVEYVGDQASVGTKTARLIGMGNYKGEKTVTYRIAPKSFLNIPNLEITVSDVEYTGNPCTPEVMVSYGTTVVDSANYDIEYVSNTNAGTATVYINGKNNYTGSVNKNFKILAKSIQNAVVTLDKALYEYNGSEIMPVLTITVDGKQLLESRDYTVTYSDNIDAGTATAFINGIGNYTGSISTTFEIDVVTGTTHTVSANKYKVTGKDSVAFIGLSNKMVKKVTIPSIVEIGGKKFKVTTVADKALKGCKVTNVTVGSNVSKIGKEAFRNTSKLKKITIKTTKLKSVGKNALKGIYSKATIKVPKKKYAAYKKLFKGKGQGKKVKIQK